MNKKKYLILSNTTGIYHVAIDEISHITVSGTCTSTFKTNGEKISCCKSLAEIIRELKALNVYENYFRVHDASLVNMQHIQHYEKNTQTIVMVISTRIKVAKRRTGGFTDKLNGQSPLIK